MTFSRFDDALDGHPKVRRIGLEAFGLWALAVVHASKYLTDGRVDSEWLHEKVPQARKREQLVGRLVTNGMLEPNGTSFIVHDYLEYNPSRVEVEERRLRASKKKAAQRASLRDTRGDTGGDD